ncbi:hypothetical protein CRYUN_Cryun14cG0027500 [Craigia yunnanensis]
MTVKGESFAQVNHIAISLEAESGELSCVASVEQFSMLEEEFIEINDEPVDLLDESIDPQIHVDRCWMLTDESPKLVRSAFPEVVVKFIQAKSQAKPGEDLAKHSNNPGDGSSKEKRKVSSPNLSKANIDLHDSNPFLTWMAGPNPVGM